MIFLSLKFHLIYLTNIVDEIKEYRYVFLTILPASSP